MLVTVENTYWQVINLNVDESEGEALPLGLEHDLFESHGIGITFFF